MIDTASIFGYSNRTGNKPVITPYDFTRPNKFPADQLNIISEIHRTTARLLSTYFSSVMRFETAVSVENVEQMTYADFIGDIPPKPSGLGIIVMKPLIGSTVIRMENELCYSLIDSISGGNGYPDIDADKCLNPIDMVVLSEIYRKLISFIKDSWAPLIKMEPSLSGFETNPLFVQIVPPEEMITLVTMTVNNNLKIQNKIFLCIPYVTIEPLLNKLNADYWYSGTKLTSGSQKISVAELALNCEFYYQTPPLSLADILAVTEGNEILLGRTDQLHIRLEAGGIPVFDLPDIDGSLTVPNREIDPTYPFTQTNSIIKTDTGESILSEFRNEFKQFAGILEERFQEIEKQIEVVADRFHIGLNDRPDSIGRNNSASRPFSFIKQTDADDLSNMLRDEYPQIIALVLSFLSPETASLVLESLPEQLQYNVLSRIAHLELIHPDLVSQIETHIKKRVQGLSLHRLYKTGGAQTVVDILNFSVRSTEKHLLDTFREKEPEVFGNIIKGLFQFEDISILNSDAIKTLLANIDLLDMAVALKNADEALIERVLSCLCEEDRVTLINGMKTCHTAPLSEVEGRQRKIAFLMRDLEESGLITIDKTRI